MKNLGFHNFKEDSFYEMFFTDIRSDGKITDGCFPIWLPLEEVIMEQKINKRAKERFSESVYYIGLKKHNGKPGIKFGFPYLHCALIFHEMKC